jgi:hypothetical protein
VEELSTVLLLNLGAALLTALSAQHRLDRHRRERLAIDVEIAEAGKLGGNVT